MPTITSSPSSFTGGPTPAMSQAVTFAIPAGTYVGATWGITYTDSNPAQPSIKTGGGTNVATFPSHGTAGTWSDTLAVTTAQLADINAAAGGNLSALLTGPIGTSYTVSSLTLTVVLSSTPPPIQYAGSMPWLAGALIGRGLSGGVLFFTPGGLPVVPAPVIVPHPPVPRPPAVSHPPGYNGVVQPDPAPPVTNVLAFVRFSMCRDNRGAVWTQEYEVGQKADIDSCGGCWLGNGFGVLYSQGGSLFWARTDNPHDWSNAAPQPVTVTSGHVYGMAHNRFGVLCAVVDSSVILSRDRGATWQGPIAIGISDPSAKPVTIVTASDEQAFVIVQPNGDSTSPTHWVSFDGGETWL